MLLSEIINLNQYPLSDVAFKKQCKTQFDNDGLLILKGFLNQNTLDKVYKEGIDNQNKAYFCDNWHNPYLLPQDPTLPDNHPRNLKIVSSKGCIADDQIPANSTLRILYESPELKSFLCHIFNEAALYPYDDNMSSINLHYAKKGQELGWHFDNSSFAITLMIQVAKKGGEFEYVRNVRDADNGDMNYEDTGAIVSGATTPNKLAQSAGDLVLFHGRNAIHRVTPNLADQTRMLVVLAYNSQAGIAISETAAKTFYGRT